MLKNDFTFLTHLILLNIEYIKFFIRLRTENRSQKKVYSHFNELCSSE